MSAGELLAIASALVLVVVGGVYLFSMYRDRSENNREGKG
jgi:hypothetical protein